ncbi:MAG: C39 family peptidase [bacterium]
MTLIAKKISIAVLLALAVTAGLAYAARHRLTDAYRDWQRGPIPEAVSRGEFEAQSAAVREEPSDQADLTQEDDGRDASPDQPTDASDDRTASATDDEPTETAETETDPTAAAPSADRDPAEITGSEPVRTINLRVPFMVQAPTANWDELHGEACEEASAIMLAAYYDDETEITTAEAEDRIMAAVAWEEENLGYHLDTTAEETARMMREHFGLTTARTVAIASLDDIRSAVAAGHPVIVPAYGKALGNPNFRNGGPLYHMLVVKGFDGDRIITNDPGTRRGADYVYDADVLWNAIHDWNNGDVPYGPKVMIVAD